MVVLKGCIYTSSQNNSFVVLIFIIMLRYAIVILAVLFLHEQLYTQTSIQDSDLITDGPITSATLVDGRLFVCTDEISFNQNDHIGCAHISKYDTDLVRLEEYTVTCQENIKSTSLVYHNEHIFHVSIVGGRDESFSDSIRVVMIDTDLTFISETVLLFSPDVGVVDVSVADVRSFNDFIYISGVASSAISRRGYFHTRFIPTKLNQSSVNLEDLRGLYTSAVYVDDYLLIDDVITFSQDDAFLPFEQTTASPLSTIRYPVTFSEFDTVASSFGVAGQPASVAIRRGVEVKKLTAALDTIFTDIFYPSNDARLLTYVAQYGLSLRDEYMLVTGTKDIDFSTGEFFPFLTSQSDLFLRLYNPTGEVIYDSLFVYDEFVFAYGTIDNLPTTAYIYGLFYDGENARGFIDKIKVDILDNLDEPVVELEPTLVWPNPAVTVAKIAEGFSIVSMYDMTGKEVTSFSVSESLLFLEELVSGQYVLLLEKNDTLYTAKITKQ